MSNQLAQGLFLLAFWAPPLAVAVCALLLLVKMPPARRESRSATLTPAHR